MATISSYMFHYFYLGGGDTNAFVFVLLGEEG